MRVRSQVISGTGPHSGEACEQIEIETRAAVTGLAVTHELPSARLIDELTLSVWLKASQDGVTLALRVVLPHQIDPRTSLPLVVDLEGDSYTRIGQWQKLECRGLPALLRRKLPQLRKLLQTEAGQVTDVDHREAYASLAVLNVRSGRGVARYSIDDLRLGPVVEAASGNEITPAAGTQDQAQPEAEFRLDRLFVGGQPYLPRIIPYHGERPDDLARMHVNAVWVPDYTDTALLKELSACGLRGIAVPPRLAGTAGDAVDQERVHLAPFTADTAPILFWYLGTKIPAESRKELALWEEQIRNADRQFKRPLMGDVAALERTYSRRLSMLGISRSCLHSSFGFKTYRDWLIERRNLSQPGAFTWTWIQIEPVPSLDDQRNRAADWGAVVEPEQIRMQVYAALAAGCRGIGYWSHSSLDEEREGALERKLAIAQVNLELTLLEPWLATSSVSSQTPFSVALTATRNQKSLSAPPAAGSGRDARRDREARLNDREIQLRGREQLARSLEAALLRTDYGLLVLPVWYADEAQLVPGQMAANDAKIVVPGVGEAARAWEVTTTAIQSLDSEPVAGGRQVTLRKFDMTAAILFTEDIALVERARARMALVREASARISLELARAKLERVARVNQALQELGMAQHDSARLLSSATARIDRADAAFQSQKYHDSRLYSADAMQLLRILQHAAWSDAVRRMYAPVSSPHTLCFQTLPDHWQMVSRFGRARGSGANNLLRSADFEDFDTLVAEGWKHEQTTIDGVRASAELYPRPHQGAYALRLVAAPETGRDAPVSIGSRPVSVTSPPVTVYKGQLIYIGGWVQVAAPSLANLEGAILYDSLGGPGAALRWRTPGDWQQFELVREVHETSELTLTMALTGLGEVRFDDLRMIALDPDARRDRAVDANPSPAPPGPRNKPLDFFRRLPGFGARGENE